MSSGPSRSNHLTVLTDALPGPLGATAAPSGCQLVVADGPQMGQAIELGATPQLVGTQAGCALILQDERVSRQHFQIQQDPQGGFIVQDLDSRNGTFYQGSKISEARLPEGAALKVGRTLLKIQPKPRALAIEPSQSRRFGALVAESLAMREIFALLALVSASDATILIGGESGTGKEIVAKAVHAHSARAEGPFVVVDCTALPESLVESELFGHAKGAFTGAQEARQGAFGRADKGTIFLDELGKLPLAAQAKLLRVLEDGRIRAVGADHERQVDVRVLAASCEPLERLVAEGQLRPDLYYRLAVISLILPPLRERREDIPLIVEALLTARGFSAGEIQGPNLQLLMGQQWPGNVRELRNALDRALAISPGARSFEQLRFFGVGEPVADTAHGAGVRTDLPFSQAKQLVIDHFERAYLGDLMARHQGNISAISRDAQLDRKHLRDLLKRHGLL